MGQFKSQSVVAAATTVQEFENVAAVAEQHRVHANGRRDAQIERQLGWMFCALAHAALHSNTPRGQTAWRRTKTEREEEEQEGSKRTGWLAEWLTVLRALVNC